MIKLVSTIPKLNIQKSSLGKHTTETLYPIIIVDEIIKLYGYLTFKFSKYTHIPQSTDEMANREIVCLDAKEVNKNLDKLFQLSQKQELCFHSTVKFHSSEVKQIPMIDFLGRDLDRIQVRLKNVLETNIYKNIYIFDSGKSYHGYSTSLLTQQEWIYFMGSLLLSNLPNEEQIVDTRWIGHSLRIGESGLRWSHNTSFYGKLPTLIRRFE